jgi:diadenosine tetraphosphate (Ap4A) HIT family hydrolase
MGQLRTKESQEKYKAYIADGGLSNGCRICEKKAIKDFIHWKIVKNIWPYDKIAEKHDMIVPKRHAAETTLTSEEWAEFQKIKADLLHQNYEYLIEATHQKKSIPGHFHLHLIVVKD